MNKAETLKRDIDLLPPSMLVDVEYFVNKLKRQSTTVKKPATLLSELANCLSLPLYRETAVAIIVGNRGT